MAFTDRVVEHPGRVKLTNVSGDVYDMTRDEGDVYTEGTLLNATNLNQETQLDNTVESLFTAAGMSGGTYQNETSDALAFLLDAMEYKTSGNWNYLLLGKTFIGLYRASATLTIGTANGSVYQTSSNSTITYPVALSAVYYANVAVATASYSVWSAIFSSSTSGIAYRALSALSRASASYSIKAIVIGEIA